MGTSSAATPSSAAPSQTGSFADSQGCSGSPTPAPRGDGEPRHVAGGQAGAGSPWAGAGRALRAMFANSRTEPPHLSRFAQPQRCHRSRTGAGPARTGEQQRRSRLSLGSLLHLWRFPFPSFNANDRKSQGGHQTGRAEVTSSRLGRAPTGDNGSCYLGQRRGNYGWHLNCHHYAPEPTLPHLHFIVIFRFREMWRYYRTGDRVGWDGMHGEADTR